MPPSPVDLPAVRTIPWARPLRWLVAGARDLVRVGWVSLAHGLALSCFGAAIMVVAHVRVWLLAGALSGFMGGAPVLATSLYALSRSVERGERNVSILNLRLLARMLRVPLGTLLE